MRRLTVIDPERLDATGHHRSVDLELVQACEELAIDLRLLDGSNFRLRTYLSDQEICSWLMDSTILDEDYARIDFVPGDNILIHTSSPWHLQALARRVRSLPEVHVAVGLMFPMTIWSKNGEILSELSKRSAQLVNRLSQQGVFFYSEIGYLELLGRRIDLPILVLPLSQKTISQIRSLKVTRQANTSDVIRFGFFGQPRAEKGFEQILQALTDWKFPKKEFCFFLPHHYQTEKDKINNLGGPNQISAVTGQFDHDQYFASMESCDVILCFYDPKYYGQQMSGIVTDAPLLGKATLITRNTEPAEFLNRYATGSFLPVEFSLDSLRHAFAATKSDWLEMKARAEASEGLLAEMKSARRFLQVSLGG